MRKFGRPDIVLVDITPDGATDAAVLLRDVAETLASGERIEPGDTVGSPAGRMLIAERFTAAMAPVVAVEGDAIPAAIEFRGTRDASVVISNAADR